MRTDFELKSLELSLKRLFDSGILKNEEQFNKLFEIYKKDNREYRFIHNEINELKYNPNLLEKKLKENELIGGNKVDNIDINKKEEYKLSLENITDFEKDGKMYIKIHYPYPYDNVRIIENRTDPYQSGKERFEEIAKKEKIISRDGILNSTSIFEQTLVKECHEINLKSADEITKPYEYSKLSSEQKEIVYGTIKAIISNFQMSDEDKRMLSSKSVDVMLKMLNKKLYISPEENIIVISEENELSKDEVKTLAVWKQGLNVNYSLKPLNETGYKYNGDENTLENNKNDSKEYDSGNDAYEKENTDDLDKELGTSLKPKAPWQKRRKKEAAFISVLWFAIFSGIIFSIIIISLTNVFINN